MTRVTPENITSLPEGVIFVYGSNEAGINGAGAAKFASSLGAKWGVGNGMTSDKTYAIPTKDTSIKTLPLDKIQEYVNEFVEYARHNFDKVFYVTAIGTGLAGYTVEQIAPMFRSATHYINIFLPQSFWDILLEDVEVKQNYEFDDLAMNFTAENVKKYFQEVRILDSKKSIGFNFYEWSQQCLNLSIDKDFDSKNLYATLLRTHSTGKMLALIYKTKVIALIRIALDYACFQRIYDTIWLDSSGPEIVYDIIIDHNKQEFLKQNFIIAQ